MTRSPHQWLLEKAQNDWTPDELFSALEALAYRLDSESIQDLFQVEMDADGYFTKKGNDNAKV